MPEGLGHKEEKRERERNQGNQICISSLLLCTVCPYEILIRRQAQLRQSGPGSKGILHTVLCSDLTCESALSFPHTIHFVGGVKTEYTKGETYYKYSLYLYSLYQLKFTSLTRKSVKQTVTILNYTLLFSLVIYC